MHDTIRQLLEQHGRLHNPVSQIASDADLYDAGLTPFAAIRVMLALEEQFALEFPVRLLRRQSFASIEAIAACVQEIKPTVRELDSRAA
ncbi:MAG: acyl carrier protein [Methylocystis sp.]|jgi:acyl carrier protein